MVYDRDTELVSTYEPIEKGGGYSKCPNRETFHWGGRGTFCASQPQSPNISDNYHFFVGGVLIISRMGYFAEFDHKIFSPKILSA